MDSYSGGMSLWTNTRSDGLMDNCSRGRARRGTRDDALKPGGEKCVHSQSTRQACTDGAGRGLGDIDKHPLWVFLAADGGKKTLSRPSAAV
jgi:hypothetical protein